MLLFEFSIMVIWQRAYCSKNLTPLQSRYLLISGEMANGNMVNDKIKFLYLLIDGFI